MMNMIPDDFQEIENIVRMIDANHAACISLLTPDGNAGASSVALSVANRLKRQAKRVLILDLNLQSPFKDKLFDKAMTLPQWRFDTISSQLNVQQQEGLYYLSVMDLCAHESAREIKVVEDTFTRWREEFDYIIVDQSPLLEINKQNIPSRVFASVVDISIMLVCSGYTTEESLAQAMQKARAEGYKNLCLVLSQIHFPPLGPKLIHSINQKAFIPVWLKRWSSKVIKQQAWLYRPIGC